MRNLLALGTALLAGLSFGAPGGWAHIVTPFCHPFHEYPKDYRRFTPDGLRQMAGDLEVAAAGWRTVATRRSWPSQRTRSAAR